jgi:hypothetical protein
LRVGAKNMQESLALLVEYGGLDKASAGKAEDYYTKRISALRVPAAAIRRGSR